MEKIKQNKITPCLWFDEQAKEAAQFYTNIFKDSEVVDTIPYLIDTPSNKAIGSTMTVNFDIRGQRFMALNGGPFFTPNPSLSFFLNFDPTMDKKASKNLDRVWNKLSSGGTVLMELGEYPFSSKYGWIQDRYGISWQLILSNPDSEDRPFVVPSLLFCNANTNKAEEAINFYTDVFNGSKIGTIARYTEDTEAAKEGSLMYSDFKIENAWIAAMDSGITHDFNFNEGISLVVNCETQQEIDYYFEKLSADPKAEVCGWLKDRYGVSWQIVPSILEELIQDKNTEKSARVMQTLLQMKKLDIAGLKEAYAKG